MAIRPEKMTAENVRQQMAQWIRETNNLLELLPALLAESNQSGGRLEAARQESERLHQEIQDLRREVDGSRREREEIADSLNAFLTEMRTRLAGPPRDSEPPARAEAMPPSEDTGGRTSSELTRFLFIVSRNNPERYAAVKQAFSDAGCVHVIFDRRQSDRTPAIHATPRERRTRRVDRDLDSLGWTVVRPRWPSIALAPTESSA